eukprot:1352683-Amorphochlora_amoeboformis.AAC.1
MRTRAVERDTITNARTRLKISLKVQFLRFRKPTLFDKMGKEERMEEKEGIYKSEKGSRQFPKNINRHA